MRISILLIFMLLFSLWGEYSVFSQTLPVNLVISEEEHKIQNEKHMPSGFYDPTIIESVNLEFYDPLFWDKMHENFGTDYYAVAKLTYGDLVYDNVGVQFKGQTSYMQPLAREEEKFSFGVKMDQFVEGQEIDGYSTLNFNNAWGDATYMKEVLYSRLAGQHIPSVQGNYIHLYLNGVDWGIYPNIQQVNNDYLKEWFLTNDGARWRADVPPLTVKKAVTETQWGDGTAALNFHGLDTALYQAYYTLKSSDIEDPWDRLVKVCDILNNTPLDSLQDSIKNYMYLDETLWFLATEILYSDDDSYVHKGKMDYALYWDIETGLMTPLEIDGNSALGIRNSGWDLFYNADNENYPLLYRLMQIPDIRKRYLAHVKTIMEESFNDSTANIMITGLKGQISSLVEQDPKRVLRFRRFLSDVDTLRKFFRVREDIIMSHPEMQFESAEISNVSMLVNGAEWASPGPDDEVHIRASVSHPSGIKEVNLYYSARLYGNFEKRTMQLDGSDFELYLKNFTAGEYVRFYFEIIADNEQASYTYVPAGAEHETYFFKVAYKALESPDIVINELMAKNSVTIYDEQGEFDDWIELYNRSGVEVSLDDFYLSDNPGNLFKWKFPENTYIAANDYLLVWADSDESFGGLHTNFKLSASGEKVYLTTAAGYISDSLDFSTQQSDISLGRFPNGTGNFAGLEPTPGSENLKLTSIEPGEGSSGIRIYPNPTHDIFYIKGDRELYENIAVYDIIGNKILDLRSEDKVDVSFLEAGIYVVTIDSSKFILVKH